MDEVRDHANYPNASPFPVVKRSRGKAPSRHVIPRRPEHRLRAEAEKAHNVKPVLGEKNLDLGVFPPTPVVSPELVEGVPQYYPGPQIEANVVFNPSTHFNENVFIPSMASTVSSYTLPNPSQPVLPPIEQIVSGSMPYQVCIYYS